ncbi:hypothetical protein [Ornithinimicrobium kibberense]|uniref:hypothetical protein n=1 Tax=Ornithinimicrobium kibberense TaxID=282060 RepID=UPI0036152483
MRPRPNRPWQKATTGPCSPTSVLCRPAGPAAEDGLLTRSSLLAPHSGSARRIATVCSVRRKPSRS